MQLTKNRPISTVIGLLLLALGIYAPFIFVSITTDPPTSSEFDHFARFCVGLFICVPLMPSFIFAWLLLYRPTIARFSIGLGAFLLYVVYFMSNRVNGVYVDPHSNAIILLLGIAAVSLHAWLMCTVKHKEGIPAATFWGTVGDGHCAGIAIACYPLMGSLTYAVKWQVIVALLLSSVLYCVLVSLLRRLRP